VLRVDRREEGGGSDSWGPIDGETRERRPAQKAQTKKENVFPAKTRPTRGLDGLAGTVSTYRGGAAGGLVEPEAEWTARSAGSK
jgi:hypothetical protein